MKIPQFIFGSSMQGPKGYQLLSATPSVGNEIVRQFCRHAPSHNALDSHDSKSEGIHFYQTDDGSCIVSRSFYGASEYSGRGGRQVITRALYLSSAQLADYGNSAIRLVDTAITLGHLLMPVRIPASLCMVELPDQPLPRSYSEVPDNLRVSSRVERLLVMGQKIFLTGVSDPWAVIDRVLSQNRWHDVPSFSLGLNPSIRREVQLLAMYQPSKQLQIKLKQRDYMHVDQADC